MNMDYPKISIVSPSFNQGQFIEDAILSVKNQNYDNFEHIIIDGGSTDNTIEILKKYPHLIWISEPDDGQSDAINKGFRMATGDIIGWINTDDCYLPNTFDIIANELSDVNIDAVYGNSRYIDESGNVTSVQITQNSIKWMSLFKCFIPSETFFFKKEIIINGLFVDKHFDMSMDKEFFAHIYYSGYKIKKVNAFLGHFRWHTSNKSLDTKPVRLIQLREGIEIFNRYSGFYLPQNKLGLFLYKTLVSIMGAYRRLCRMLGIRIYRNK